MSPHLPRLRKKHPRTIEADEARVTTRTTEGVTVTGTHADDPLAGTVDDPDVVDPYAHLRNKEKEQGTTDTGDDETAAEEEEEE